MLKKGLRLFLTVILSLLLGVIIILFVYGSLYVLQGAIFITLISIGDYGVDGDDVFALVEENYDAIVEACQEKDIDALYAIDGITKVNIDDGYVLVYCMGKGIVTSSQDYGFYYSEDNMPVAVDCNNHILCDTEDLTPEGNGYQYIYQYNTFYTEHIKGNIYFYSTAY